MGIPYNAKKETNITHRKEMRTYAIFNAKGGVSKTTTAANLGGALAAIGRRVLLVDADPQTSLTKSLSGPVPADATLYAWMRGTASGRTVQIRDGLHIIPAESGILKLEGKIGYDRLRGILSRLEGFDYAIIDCPPGIGTMTKNALLAADGVIVPTVPELLPLAGLEDVDALTDEARKANPGLSRPDILITRYNGRKLHKQIEEQIRARYGERVFRTHIRENISIAEAPYFRQTIDEYSPRSNGATDYAALAQELTQKDKQS